MTEHKNIRAALDQEEARGEHAPEDGGLMRALVGEPRVTLHLTHDQIRMVHHALANLGNTDPLKSDAFRELFGMISAHVQVKAP